MIDPTSEIILRTLAETLLRDLSNPSRDTQTLIDRAKQSLALCEPAKTKRRKPERKTA